MSRKSATLITAGAIAGAVAAVGAVAAGVAASHANRKLIGASPDELEPEYQPWRDTYLDQLGQPTEPA